MLDASLSGRAAPDSKTINVEANLLAERLTERGRLLEFARRRLLLIGVALFVGGLSLPAIYKLQADAEQKAVAATKKMRGLAAELTLIRKQQENAQPRLDSKQALETARRRANLLLGHSMLVMNSVPPTMALSNLKVEVLDGGLKITGQADAESFSTARSFVAQTGTGPDAQAAILIATRRNDRLAEGGVFFEFVKRAMVRE